MKTEVVLEEVDSTKKSDDTIMLLNEMMNHCIALYGKFMLSINLKKI